MAKGVVWSMVQRVGWSDYNANMHIKSTQLNTLTRLLAKGVVTSMVRRMGWKSEKHSTGAATLEIHMEANAATCTHTYTL